MAELNAVSIAGLMQGTPQTCRTHKENISMEYSGVSEFKPLDHNPYERYYRKIVRIQPIGNSKSINGEVVSITDRHITLEHLDGRRTLIRISEIAVISEVPRKAPAAEA